jgi:hypothetical protein
MEQEQSGQLSFLPVMVKKQDNQLIFDVYRKTTSSKRYMTAESFHPQSQKNAAFHQWRIDCAISIYLKKSI